jgi:hypothetical protein
VLTTCAQTWNGCEEDAIWIITLALRVSDSLGSFLASISSVYVSCSVRAVFIRPFIALRAPNIYVLICIVLLQLLGHSRWAGLLSVYVTEPRCLPAYSRICSGLKRGTKHLYFMRPTPQNQKKLLLKIFGTLNEMRNCSSQ